MKVAFVSNYYNHHQAPFSEAMARLTDGQYWFVATEEMSRERKNMGWGREELPDYVIQSFESAESLGRAKQKIDDADVVIFGLTGWSNFQLVRDRLKKRKLTFRYSERIYKDGLPWYRLPIQAIKLWLVGGKYPSMYLLCASAYAAQDYAKTGCYLGKTYQWGYFPRVKRYDVDALMERKAPADTEKISLLWAGRLLWWKHPEAAITLAAALKEKEYNFTLNLIGNGEMEAQLRRSIQEKKLDDYVKLLGAMTPEEVRTHMEKADIYLFTSDFHEGWGAVLNESMNSGCAVVASHAIGSVPYLVRNGENGLIYENGNQEHLEAQVIRLLENPVYRRQLGRQAYHTVVNTWNAENAAERLLSLAQALAKGEKTVELFHDGPCSRAEVLSNDWYRGD